MLSHAHTHRRAPRAALVTMALGLALTLTGCATGPATITSQVQSYASMGGVQLPATYRLELLPSQAQQASFTRIEQAAEQALRRVGLTRDSAPEHARLVVQVGATATQGRAYHPAYDSWYGPRFGFGLGMGRGGWGGGFGMGMMMDTPPVVYVRGVKLVVRDQRTQQIVYETSAHYDEVRPYDDVIWNVLFDAALSGFPTPPSGPRQVTSTLQPLPAPATQAAPATPLR